MGISSAGRATRSFCAIAECLIDNNDKFIGLFYTGFETSEFILYIRPQCTTSHTVTQEDSDMLYVLFQCLLYTFPLYRDVLRNGTVRSSDRLSHLDP